MNASIFKEFIYKQDEIKDRIFLLEKITDCSGFFVFNKCLSFVISGASNQKNAIATKYVEFIPNTEIVSVYNYPSFEKGVYDFLVLKEQDDDEIIESFIRLCLLYAKNPSIPFDEFIQSVVELFQLINQQNYLDCVGMFGELIFLKTLYEKNIDLTPFWHLSGVFSKYDLSLLNMNIEIKTSSSDSTSFKIKHSQIFNNEKNIVALVSIRPTELSGMSLEDLVLFFKTEKPFSENLRFIIVLEKELHKVINPDSYKKRFALNDFYFFECSKIETIRNIPLNISNISYDYWFDLNESFDMEDFIRRFLNEKIL